MKRRRPLVIAIATAAAIALGPSATAPASSGGTGVTKAAGGGCGDVVVQFEPEGSGGASGIKADGIDCDSARGIAKDCINGDVREGWTAVTWTKTKMTKGDKQITFTLVGGGGCGEFPKSCDDFSHRGVGFFGMRVLGLDCSKGKDKAKSWYDKGGDCSFGSTCDIGKYTCEGNANTATVTCKREDGYRFSWQMGE